MPKLDGRLKTYRNPARPHAVAGRAIAGFAQMGRPRLEWPGESYRHPDGYVPVYGPLTDLAAFRAGMDAYSRREMLRTNPYGTRTASDRKAWNSWIDGWCWAAGRDCNYIPPRETRPWRGRGTAVG